MAARDFCFLFFYFAFESWNGILFITVISHRIKIPYKLVFIYILQYIYEKCLYIGDGVTKKNGIFY